MAQLGTSDYPQFSGGGAKTKRFMADALDGQHSMSNLDVIQAQMLGRGRPKAKPERLN
jgi:hypothetical protein